MKLCMMAYTCYRQPEHYNVIDMLDLAQELGLGVDIGRMDPYTPQEWRAMVDDRGIPVACYTFFADLTPADRKERQPGIDAAKRGIETALMLGTNTVMIPPMGNPAYPRDETRRHIIDGLAEVVDFARNAGVTITLENFPGKTSPCVTSGDMLEVIAAVPEIRVTFDNGNCVTGGEDATASFINSAPYVVHAHFKDWTLSPAGQGMEGLDGRWYTPALLGEGIIDHRSCLAAMQQAGYSGYIDLEYESDRDRPLVATRKMVAYLRG